MMSKNGKNRNLDCDIVSDLLALYHDGIVKDTTKESVKQHLEKCAFCKKEYDALCVKLPIESREVSISTKDKFVNMMKKAKRNRMVTSIIVVILVVALLIGGYFLQGQFLIANVPNENITIHRIYRYETDGQYKLFVLYSQKYLGASRCYISSEEDGDTLVMNIKKPLIVPSWQLNYEEMEEFKDVGIYESVLTYRYGYLEEDEAGEQIKFDTVKLGQEVIWNEAEHGDNEIPAYVYAYDDFETKGAGSMAWISDVDEGFLQAEYEDGHYIKWDLDGNVLEEGYFEKSE